ncbi:MAG: hypothetical protein NPINA01_12980 [Nitrospinaceae bacterium]|nr:MAG: hypothetical protein NPINA01_12980 [Nitrospinaceae bacterium]
MFFNIDEIRDDVLEFAVRENKENFERDHPECPLVRDIEVSGTLRRSGKDIHLSGKVDTELSVTCSRCLEPFKFPVKSAVTAHFVPEAEPDNEHGEVELHASDIDIEYHDGNRVDITQAVHDQILLALPLVCLCKKDCKGLCSNCGKNLNLGPCGCSQEAPVDPRLEVLKSLKDKLK